MAGLSQAAEPLQVADIGGGTGASTLILAEKLNTKITAIDLFRGFLDVLRADAQKGGVADKITTLAGRMEDLPFEEINLDVLWGEGSILQHGF